MLAEFKHRNQKGFTLIEILVTVVIGLLVLMGLYQMLDHNQKVFRAQQQMTIMNNQVRSSMEAIIRTIRTAGNNKAALGGAPMIYTAQESLIRVISDLPKDQNDPLDDDSDGDVCDDPNGYSYDISDCGGDTIDGNQDDEDENGDLRLNDAFEDVTFLLSGTDIILRQFSASPGLETGAPPDIPAIPIDPDPPAESSEVIAENILNLTFSYMSDSNTFIAMSGSPLSVDVGDLKDIQIVRVKIVAQTDDRDRATGRFHTIELTSDVELRNRN